MAGAILPDDPGAALTSYCVAWPEGQDWRELLFGMLTRLANDAVWYDATPEQAELATQSVLSAFGETLLTYGGCQQMINVPQALVYLNTTDLWSNNTNISDINFNVQLYDTDNMWGPFIGAEIRKIKANTAGVYLVTCGWGWAANTAGIRVLRILHNGATRYYSQTINPGASPLQMTVGGPIRMAAGDYVQMEIYQNSGGDLSAYRPITLSLYLSATLISYL
jgi:hypothetical protein